MFSFIFVGGSWFSDVVVGLVGFILFAVAWSFGFGLRFVDCLCS